MPARSILRAGFRLALTHVCRCVPVVDIDSLLAARLGKGRSEGPEAVHGDLADGIWQRVQFHGIALALCETPGALDGLPEQLRERVRDEARLQVLWEETHRSLLQQIFSALSEADVSCLVFKGTGLAYSMYDNPAVRRRGDSDLLVRRTELGTTRKVLFELGMTKSGSPSLGQETWLSKAKGGFIHAIDLHWEIIGPPALRELMSVEQCFSRAIALPRLAPAAHTLDHVFTLLRGAINHGLHGVYGYGVDGELQFAADRIIWRLDTHLVAESLADAEWRELLDISSRMGIASLLLQELCKAKETFGNKIPEGILAALEACDKTSPLQGYLWESSEFGRARMNLKACRSWRDFAELASFLLFPDEERMRVLVPTKRAWPLPVLYVYRIVRGCWKLASRKSG